jgi:hypothetical protein
MLEPDILIGFRRVKNKRAQGGGNLIDFVIDEFFFDLVGTKL